MSDTIAIFIMILASAGVAVGEYLFLYNLQEMVPVTGDVVAITILIGAVVLKLVQMLVCAGDDTEKRR